jgi:hypothetical protein
MGMKFNKKNFEKIMIFLINIKEEIQSLKQNKASKKEDKNFYKLRDSIYHNHYILFMLNARSGIKKNIVCRKIQLRLLSIVLDYFGLRLNEVRFITKNDFINRLGFGLSFQNKKREN